MKANIKAFFIWILYRVKFDEPDEWGDNVYRWNYELIPIYWRVYLLWVIISPILILAIGLVGTFQFFREPPDTKAWSSFEFYLKPGEKPSKWEAYKKY